MFLAFATQPKPITFKKEDEEFSRQVCKGIAKCTKLILDLGT